MECLDMSKVGLDCGRKETPRITEVGDPFKDGGLASGEIRAVAVEEMRVEGNEVEEGLLPGAVGFACAGCEAVPKEECDLRGEVSMDLKPTIWGLVEQLWWGRYGASRNKRVY
jgi:hypothetical protein